METSDDAFRAAEILVDAYGRADGQAAVNRAIFLEARSSNVDFARRVTEAVILLAAQGSTGDPVKHAPVES
ncbi:MAG: hypothetical protein H6893_13470 [Brucellaceae bacterium]|nr:hypothetical protein [Brucellaceae bacterium]